MCDWKAKLIGDEASQMLRKPVALAA